MHAMTSATGRRPDGPGIVVPYNTDGKARCERLELIEIVEAGND